MADHLPIGSHLLSNRYFKDTISYTHHGVYVGDGQVIHYAGNSGDPEADGEKIQVVTVEKFHGGFGFWVVPHASCAFTSEQIVRRAQTRLGENGYSVFSNNCEHFCNWVIDDNHLSQQVDKGALRMAAASGGVGGLVGGVAIPVGAAAATGLVGGAAMMKGLAIVGTVAGGAVGGLATVGGGLGAATALVVNKTILRPIEIDPDTPLKSDHIDEENDARRIGRAASLTGAAGAAACTVAAVSAAGSVSGLSAAGITSGLAAIGGTVGGGMATGIAIGVAAPAVAAVGLGYGAFKLAQNHDGVREGLISTAETAGNLAKGAMETAAPIVKEASGQAAGLAKVAATNIAAATSEHAPAVADAAKTAAQATRSGLLSVLVAVEGGAKALKKKLEG